MMAFAALVASALLFTACESLRPPKTPSRKERGMEFSHATHLAAKMECASCHDFNAKDPLPLNHALCSVCHIAAAPLAPGAQLTPPNTPDHQGPNAQNCALCHVAGDYKVKDLKPRLSGEIKFDHKPHVAKGVACSECHGDPDKKPLPDHNLMPDCMKCHAKVDNKLNDCTVCHKELNTTTVPSFHGTRRIQHDVQPVWEKVHGREALEDKQYCSICHKDEGFCSDCHRVTKPQSHTIPWERENHGLEASWDRQKCAVCHEEDSCVRCHERTKPQSHTGSFADPINTHCVECHYPRGDNSCAVCHQEIEHEKAGPAIHKLGVYPPHCADCHPGGSPTRAPHILNSTVECRVCHR